MTKLTLPLLLALLTLGGCKFTEREGMVLMLDQSYRASVVGRDGDGFTAPDGLLWNDGKLYIADEGGSAVRVWSGRNSARTLAQASSGISSPEDLVIDGDGNILFTDDSAGGVWRIGRDGKTSTVAGKAQGLTSTEGIALAPDGTILIGDAPRHRVVRLDASGKASVFLAGISKPESMAFDAKGNLYIADNQDDVLYRVAADRKLHRAVHGLEGFSPESIWHAGGTLFITDSKHGKLFRYTEADGLQPLTAFAGKLAKVAGVTTDDRGRIYVSVQSDLKAGRGYMLRIEKRTRL